MDRPTGKDVGRIIVDDTAKGKVFKAFISHDKYRFRRNEGGS
jgi:hypothetical protein